MRFTFQSLLLAVSAVELAFAFVPLQDLSRHPSTNARSRLLVNLFPKQNPSAASPSASWRIHSRSSPFLLRASGSSDDDDDDGDDDDIDLSEADDWRAFRAKLVMSENAPTKSSSSTTTKSGQTSKEDDKKDTKASGSAVESYEDDLDGIGALFSSSSQQDTAAQGSSLQQASQLIETMTPLDPSQWAYDSGKVIEQGAVILGGTEQTFGFGLRQQYFQKAAILVLDHEVSTFTKGIILNRPTDLTLDDDINKGVKWRVWFGGDVQGLDSQNPDIVCLHSLKNEQVKEASVPVMKDIQWTTFDNAKRLVRVGAAKPTDFWVFCGYAGWGPGQLMGELDRKSWYMVATDSQTLLKELARQSAGADPRDAGLETWTLLMNMIGRKETAEEYSGDFDDLMLKEWALKHLLSTEAGGGAGQKRLAPEGIASTQELQAKDPVDRLLDRVTAASRGEDVKAGAIVRASSANRSPFLLSDQELHKSLVLIISDDDNISIGVILNRPAARGLDINIKEKEKGKSITITLPLRYGGQYAVKGSEPLLWLHCSPTLRAANIGAPVGDDYHEGIWKCTANDVTTAVSRGLAKPTDFLVVTGVSIWTKGQKGLARGMRGEVRSGNFAVVPEGKTQEIWQALSNQDVLTPGNLMQSVSLANKAWNLGTTAEESNGSKKAKNGDTVPPPIGGIGEGFEEEDETMVWSSDVKVSKLSDDALRSWLATFLLGAPTLGG